MIDESAGASEHASIRRTAERHAVIAASVCATLGVVSGFAIYLIFARLLVQEETGRGLTGLIVGLAVAAAFTALIDWVREVIHKGEAVFGWPSWRALPQALLIILAFELTITALHEAAKDTIVELRTIQNIGAKIAGKKISGLGPNRNERDLTNLYRQLQDDIQQYGFVNVPISEGPSSVAARLIPATGMSDSCGRFAIPLRGRV